jgi:nitrite reductase/ring-hydroxylating ferredoxin subunit
VDIAAAGSNHGIAMRLRVVPPAPTEAGCGGCSRRAVLHGLAVTAASALVGCPGGETLAPDADPGSITWACGNNLCVDLNDPKNAALTKVDGTLIVTAPHDIILLVRTSTTAVAAVSDVCTHAMCGVRYDRVNKILTCPCHGSKYTLLGGVIQGPAFRPLARYQTQLDPTTNQLTIVL